jgi:hypothetical protein
MSGADFAFLAELSDECSDRAAASRGILDIAGAYANKYNTEEAILLLMLTTAIAARAVNLTPKQTTTSLRRLRGLVDEITRKLGPGNADVEAIMVELSVR